MKLWYLTSKVFIFFIFISIILNVLKSKCREQHSFKWAIKWPIKVAISLESSFFNLWVSYHIIQCSKANLGNHLTKQKLSWSIWYHVLHPNIMCCLCVKFYNYLFYIPGNLITDKLIVKIDVKIIYILFYCLSFYLLWLLHVNMLIQLLSRPVNWLYKAMRDWLSRKFENFNCSGVVGHF